MNGRTHSTPTPSSATTRTAIAAAISPRGVPDIRAKLVAAWLLAPPDLQKAVMEEMRQLVASYQPCRPVVATPDELRRELEGGAE